MHPNIAGLGVDADQLLLALESLGPDRVRVDKDTNIVHPVMRAERSTLTLRECTASEAELKEFILSAECCQDSGSSVLGMRYESVGNTWFVTMSSSGMAMDTALWLRSHPFKVSGETNT